MKRISALLDPYRGLPKEIYIIFISRIINAMGCFVMPLLTLILTEKIGLSKELSGAYISVAGLLFMPASIIGGPLYENYLPLIFIGDAVTALISLSLILIFIKETIHLTKQEVTEEGRHLESREEGTILSVLVNYSPPKRWELLGQYH